MGISPKSSLYQGFIRRNGAIDPGSAAPTLVPFLAADGLFEFKEGFSYDKATDLLSVPSSVDIRGVANTGGILTLSTSDTEVVTGNVLGRINFQAPDEASGGDANLVGASIYAEAEADFTSSVNATKMIFAIGNSETALETMVLALTGSNTATLILNRPTGLLQLGDGTGGPNEVLFKDDVGGPTDCHLIYRTSPNQLIIENDGGADQWYVDMDDGKCWILGECEINGAFNHDGSMFGALGHAPATVRGEYTLTYSAETRTHDAVTSTGITETITQAANFAFVDVNQGFVTSVNPDIIDRQFAACKEEMNAIAADLLNLKQLVNSGIQDDKDFGFNTVA